MLRSDAVRTLIVLVASVATVAAAGQTPSTPTTAPARRLNPKILALGDNTWLKMDPPREPEGRNYSGACWGDWGAGGRAFYFGGAHFSYRYDDVEFYDPAANTWTRSWEDRIDWMALRAKAAAVKDPEAKSKAQAELRERSVKTGRLPPVHTYQQVCWVPPRRVFFYLGHSGNWQFDPVKMRWTCLALPPLHQSGRKKMIPWTRWAVQTQHCYYHPKLRAVVAITTHRPQGDWLYDLASGEWRALKRNIRSMGGEIYSAWAGPLQAQLLCNRIGKMHLHKVSAEASEWTEIEEFPQALKGCEALAYDSANEVVLAVAPARKRAPLAVWALAPKTMKWREMKPAGEVPRGSGLWAPLWYDRDHNALFFLNRTGQTGCETWVYRYKRTTQAAQEIER